MDTPELAYIVLRCADLERSRIFYEALGIALVAERHGSGAKHYAAAFGNLVLELYPLHFDRTSGMRLGLRVADPSAIVEAVRIAGGEVLRVDPKEATVRDPDGHTIHLARR